MLLTCRRMGGPGERQAPLGDRRLEGRLLVLRPGPALPLPLGLFHLCCIRVRLMKARPSSLAGQCSHTERKSISLTRLHSPQRLCY